MHIKHIVERNTETDKTASNAVNIKEVMRSQTIKHHMTYKYISSDKDQIRETEHGNSTQTAVVATQENTNLTSERHSHQSHIDKEEQDSPQVVNTTKEKLQPEERFKKYPPFQSAKEIDFQTTDGTDPRIPHIIHQVYTNESLPDAYRHFITTFTKYNTKWEYRFWSYDSGRKLLAKRHPYLIPAYDRFAANDVKRSDMLRLAVLYEFGGFYADLDVKNLRPLDRATMKYACILTPEPFEHAAIIIKRTLLLSTAVMLCRPKHPFFQQLLKNMENVDPNSHPVKSVGPQYITAQYLTYNNLTISDLNKNKTDNISNSPYFYKGSRSEENNDGIYIPNSQYFMDVVDKGNIDKDGNLKKCPFHAEEIELLPFMYKRGCAEYENRREVRRNRKYTFTVHHWHHLWILDQGWLKSLKTMHIREIVPNCTLYR